jgi:hypothetical protein
MTEDSRMPDPNPGSFCTRWTLLGRLTGGLMPRAPDQTLPCQDSEGWARGALKSDLVPGALMKLNPPQDNEGSSLSCKGFL